MTDQTKKALKEMEEARDEVDKLCMWEEYDSSKPVPCLDSDALAVALEKERLARIKFHTLLYKGMDWSDEQIENWLKKSRLK